MTYNFRNLDNTTREFMLNELQRDIEMGTQYISPRIKKGNEDRYLTLLEQTITNGQNEDHFASNLRRLGYLIKEEQRKSKNGITNTVKVPINAAETLAHGEFNRYYMRALCLRASEENRTLIIYRAKQVNNPTDISKQILGNTARADILLEILRNIETAKENFPNAIEIHISRPNSGLSVYLQ
ncbi:hypothetical protein HDR58_11175 [bacterium]|nr:hypothetical protein [bacterium]